MISEWLCGASTEFTAASGAASGAQSTDGGDDGAENGDDAFEIVVKTGGGIDHKVMVRPSMTLPYLKRLIAATSLRAASAGDGDTSSSSAVYPSVLIVRGRPPQKGDTVRYSTVVVVDFWAP